MAKSQSLVKTTPANLVKTEVKGTKLVQPLVEAVEELTITDADSYKDADGLLSTISDAMKQWDAEIEPVLKPAREVKMAADALNRRFAVPLKQLYDVVRAKMTEYKREEQRQLIEANRQREVAEANARFKLEEASAKEDAAKTAAMRDRLRNKREEAEEALAAVQATDVNPVKGEHSSTRTVKRWRVKDADVALRAWVTGRIPRNVYVMDDATVNKQMAADPDVVHSWPGFEVYDDIIIARKG